MQGCRGAGVEPGVGAGAGAAVQECRGGWFVGSSPPTVSSAMGLHSSTASSVATGAPALARLTPTTSRADNTCTNTCTNTTTSTANTCTCISNPNTSTTPSPA